MKNPLKKFTAFLICCATLTSSFLISPSVRAAETLYDDDFETIAKLGEANKCYSAQGMAVGDTYLYAAQIGDNDSRAVIHRVERDTGDRVLMTHGETGLSYFTNLSHCNDMDWAVIDGVEYLYVLAGSKVIVFRIDEEILHPHAEYNLKYNGNAFSPGGMAIQTVTSKRITFLFKWGRTISAGMVSATAEKANISVSVRCNLDVSRVKVDGKVQDFTSFVNQGMGYENGYLFVPITGNNEEETINHSLLLTYDMSQAKSGNTIQPVDEMTFYVICDEYAGLFEIEDCGISSDGRLYFNTNSRVSASNTKHDGVFVLNDFVMETTYTVKYDANGGTGSMASATVAVDTAITPAENTFTREGYTFTGWKAYSTAQKKYVNIGDKAAAGDTVTFYAQWEKNAPTTYTVQYNANGGTGSMASATVAVDTAITPAENTFTREGYTFTGWKAYSTSQKKYVNIGDKAAAGDTVTFYAQWEKNAPITYTVQYDANGGTGSMASATVAVDTAISPAENTFTREGYTFTGWKAYSTAQDREVDMSYRPAAGDTITFYAQWEKNAPTTYTVQYDANGGVGTMEEQTVKADTPLAPMANAFTRDGYIFMGWKAYSTTQEQDIPAGAAVTPGDTVILSAQWYLCGDVNGDGKLTIADALAIRLYADGCYPVPAMGTEIMDVNGDGAVNVSDAHVLFAYIAGAIEKLPAGE